MDERRGQYGQQRGGGGPGRRNSQDSAQEAPSKAVAEFVEAIKSKEFTEDEVMNLSDGLARSFIREGGEGQKENSLTQVRKFYNQVKVLQQRANAEQADFSIIKPQVRLLQAQAAYSVARKLMTGDFKKVFDEAGNKIIREGRDSLNAFAEFFQAVYAYYYYHVKR